MEPKPGVDIFNRDVAANTGYLYTHTDRLSCKLATRRTTDIILQTGEMTGRSVVDMACGDAYYTFQFWDQAHPSRLVAADAAANAVAVGEANSAGRPISFLVCDAHSMPFPDNSFDVALLQSVLHHDDDPQRMIREAFRIAPRVLIHEPNGNNPGLKIIEKTSRYHLEHGEKSYGTRLMRRWIKEAGGSVVYTKVAGFVPMFCPDWMARSMKFVEPLVESVPGFRWMACAVYVMVGVRDS
jgi:ubiquinone/menaquinone biosynthesis C-methylase UbiE